MQGSSQLGRHVQVLVRDQRPLIAGQRAGEAAVGSVQQATAAGADRGDPGPGQRGGPPLEPRRQVPGALGGAKADHSLRMAAVESLAVRLAVVQWFSLGPAGRR
jgi:hypothetical protein